MVVHVIESKIYGGDFFAPEIKEVLDEAGVVESWLLFEGILAEVQGELGILPLPIAQEIRKKASLKFVNMERIVEIYRKTKLASVATIRALAEVCEGGAGEYVHYGSCSPELFENTLAYRIGKIMDILEKDLKIIRGLLNRLAETHRFTLMAERSHGQQAIPITFGLIAAIWSDAVSKHLERFQEARKRVLLGSVKGAVGTYGSHYMISGEQCVELEKRVLAKLGLFVNRISFRRHIDRLTEFMNLLSLLAVTFEKICGDIFTQQRNEIGELEEPFDTENQIGSSTLPQKRNPVLVEAIMAWAKKIRSNASAFAETHMTDSHDFVGFYMEDLVIPETCVLAGAMLNNAKRVFEGIVVKKDAMRRNLDMLNGLTMTEHLMLALSKKTGKKQTAHAIIHKFAMEAFERNVPIDQLILASDEILQYIPKEEMAELLKPENHLGMTQWCIDNVIKE
jgi:adenylosuccinate lyase